MEAVSSRLEAAIKMRQVTKGMKGVVTGMDKVLQTMDVDKITQVMDKFEKSFEDMDVRSEYIEGAMNSSTTAAMPEEQVRCPPHRTDTSSPSCSCGLPAMCYLRVCQRSARTPNCTAARGPVSEC